MNFQQYQSRAVATAVYPEQYEIIYPLIGLTSEVGELASIVQRELRDDTPLDEDALRSELGDILWHLAALCEDLGLDLDQVAEQNIRKLADREMRGAIKGKGGDR